MTTVNKRIVFPAFLLLFVTALLPTGATAEPGWIANAESRSYFVRTGDIYMAARGFPIKAGDTIRTNRKGRMRVLFGDNSILSIGNRSEVELPEVLFDRDRILVIKPTAGTFRLDLATWADGESRFQVFLGDAKISADRGLAWGDVDKGKICVLDGSLTVDLQEGDSIVAASGSCVTGLGGKQPGVVATDSEMVTGGLKRLTFD